jgi:hypothetical protein
MFWFLVLAICPACAQAYIDPGTGGMLLDALAAVVLGIGIFWRHVKAFLRSLFGKNPPPDSQKKSVK